MGYSDDAQKRINSARLFFILSTQSNQEEGGCFIYSGIKWK